MRSNASMRGRTHRGAITETQDPGDAAEQGRARRRPARWWSRRRRPGAGVRPALAVVAPRPGWSDLGLVALSGTEGEAVCTLVGVRHGLEVEVRVERTAGELRTLARVPMGVEVPFAARRQNGLWSFQPRSARWRSAALETLLRLEPGEGVLLVVADQQSITVCRRLADNPGEARSAVCADLDIVDALSRAGVRAVRPVVSAAAA